MSTISPLEILTEPLVSDDVRFAVSHRQELIHGFVQAKLKAARAGLVGAGGLNGEVGEGLCRKGIGHLWDADHDVVEYTNLNRQHFFKEDIGKPKAHCLIRNLSRHCHAGTTLVGHPYSFQDALALGVDLSASVVVCGVDNSQARVAVSRHYRTLGVPVVFIAVDLLAECGHVFIQEGAAASPCFGCAFPNSLAPRKTPCFVPASKDALKVTAGLALYAVDSLLMARRRNWNFRRVHLAGFAPDVLETIERNPNCQLCSKTQEQGSPAVGTSPHRASTGSDSPFPSE